MSEETGLSKEYIKDNEQKRTVFDSFNNGYYAGLNNSDELFILESHLIKDLADKETCEIVGRWADYIIKEKKKVLK